MAETATADAPAETPKEVEAQPPPAAAAAPPAPPSGLGSIADRISATEADLIAARKKEREGLEAKSAALAPRLSQATSALDTRAQQLAQNPPPAPPVLAPPPSRNLSAFLSPRQGESPEASVQKLIQAIGLFAGGVGGLARGDARGSLAAFTGALKGWNEGDIERGDRAFKDWEAKTSTALKAWETERTAYTDWIAASNLQLDHILQGIKLEAAQQGNRQAILELETGNLEKFQAFLVSQQKAATELEAARAKLAEAHEARLGREAYNRERLEEQKRHNRETEEATKKQAQNALDALGPDGLQAMGRMYLEGKLPPGIARGKAGTILMPQIVKAGIDWAKAQGIDPMSLPAIQADVSTLKDELKKLRTTTVLSEAQASRFDTHMDALVQLSERMDKNGRPVFERWRQKVEGKYNGDEDVAVIETQALEVAMEYVKLTVGTAQGDAATREEGRKVINSWMSKAQMRGVGEQLKQNAHNNVALNRATEQGILHRIDTLGGRIDRGPAPAPAKVVMPNDPKPGSGRKRIEIYKPNTDERGEVYADSNWQAAYPGWKAAQ